MTRFDLDHPDFRSARADAGRLKFSHWRHLMPGITAGAGDKTPPWTLVRIADPVQRNRYRHPGQTDDSPVQLQCDSCHQLDSGDFPVPPVEGPSPAPRARCFGAYMLPITYENQCRTCHPLSYESDSADVVPHGQSPGQIRRWLQGNYVGQYLEHNPQLLEQYLPPRPLPGAPSLPLQETARKRIDHRVAVAEAMLSQAVCGKCHLCLPSDRPGLAAVVPPQIPQAWLNYARFDHSAHRAVNCRQCHPRAYADDPQASRRSSDVLIPRRDTCLACHGPRRVTAEGLQGGARFDCAECHQYHHGSVQGIGAQVRDPQHKLDLQQFLSGGSSERTDNIAREKPRQ